MKIGITGASGHLGNEVLSRLVAPDLNQELVALGRTHGRSSQGSATWRYSDYDRPETLAKSFEGLDRLLIVPTPDLQPGAIGRQLCAAIEAAVDVGVGHIYLLSALHAAGSPSSSDLTRSYISAEQYLAKREANATVFRMSFYVETFADIAKMSLAHGTLFGLTENKVSFISRSDVAMSLASALKADALPKRHYDLTGCASISGAERAQLVAELSGHAMIFSEVSEVQLRELFAQASMPDFIIESLIGMQKTFAEGAFDLVTDDVLSLTGRAPRPIAQTLRETMQKE